MQFQLDNPMCGTMNLLNYCLYGYMELLFNEYLEQIIGQHNEELKCELVLLFADAVSYSSVAHCVLLPICKLCNIVQV